jgi:hypothetical protein
VSQSPRFNAPLIGLRSLGFVGALWAWRMLVPVPRLASLLLWHCVRGGQLPYTTDVPDQDADRIGFPIRRSGDHIPNTIFRKKGSFPLHIAESAGRLSAVRVLVTEYSVCAALVEELFFMSR